MNHHASHSVVSVSLTNVKIVINAWRHQIHLSAQDAMMISQKTMDLNLRKLAWTLKTKTDVKYAMKEH